MLINLDKHQFGVGFTLATVYILYNYISNILRTISSGDFSKFLHGQTFYVV